MIAALFAFLLPIAFDSALGEGAPLPGVDFILVDKSDRRLELWY